MKIGQLWDFVSDEHINKIPEADWFVRFFYDENWREPAWPGIRSAKDILQKLSPVIEPVPVIRLFYNGDPSGSFYHQEYNFDFGRVVELVSELTAHPSVNLIQIGNEIDYLPTTHPTELEKVYLQYIKMFREVVEWFSGSEIRFIFGGYRPPSEGASLWYLAGQRWVEDENVILDLHGNALSNSELEAAIAETQAVFPGVDVGIFEDCVKPNNRWETDWRRLLIAEEVGCFAYTGFGRWLEPVWGVNTKRNTSLLGLEGPNGLNEVALAMLREVLGEGEDSITEIRKQILQIRKDLKPIPDIVFEARKELARINRRLKDLE